MDDRRKKIKYYPIALSLKDQLVVVVGGGKVAERKITNLLDANALVKIISPKLAPNLQRLVKRKKLVWRKRRAQKKDLAGAKILIAATNDSRVNEDVSRWAASGKVLVNVVDNPGLSDFISPAVMHNHRAIVAVYTNGKDPVLSRDLKNFLKDNWHEFLSYRRRLQ